MLSGLDVSHHQGTIDFSEVARAGHRFVIAKATEGRTFVDRFYDNNLVSIQKEGMVAGAYHFLRSDSDPEVQANHFLDVVGNTTGLLCVLDVESHLTSKPTISQVYKWAYVFRTRTHGQPLIIYTGRWYWVGTMGNPDGGRIGPLWHSAYTRDPGRLYGGWSKFTFWQYTSSGRSPGVNGNVDRNWFYGGIADLHALTGVKVPDDPTDDEASEMLIVQNQDNGAALLYGGGVSVLIETTAHLKDLVNKGIPHCAVTGSQFKRYELVRLDDGIPNNP